MSTFANLLTTQSIIMGKDLLLLCLCEGNQSSSILLCWVLLGSIWILGVVIQLVQSNWL